MFQKNVAKPYFARVLHCFYRLFYLLHGLYLYVTYMYVSTVSTIIFFSLTQCYKVTSNILLLQHIIVFFQEKLHVSRFVIFLLFGFTASGCVCEVKVGYGFVFTKVKLYFEKFRSRLIPLWFWVSCLKFIK